MEQVAWDVAAAAVDGIPRDGVPEMLEVDTDLVGASGLGLALDEAAAGFASEHTIGGAGFAAAGIDGHFLAVDLVAGDGGVDETVGHAGHAVGDREINLRHAAVGELARERDVRRVALRHHEATARLFVQAVDDSGTLDASDGGETFAVMEQGVDECSLGHAGSRMHGEAGGFVEHEEGFVLVQDIQRAILGHEVRRHDSLLGSNPDDVALGERHRGAGGGAVDRDPAAFQAVLHARSRDTGEHRCGENIEAHAGVVGTDHVVGRGRGVGFSVAVGHSCGVWSRGNSAQRPIRQSKSFPPMSDTPDEPQAEEATAEPIVESCPSCGGLMDVTEVMPMSEVVCPSCGQTSRVRQAFNHFTLLGVLGEGGMGSVFKALDNNLDRHVALKVLKKEFSKSEEDWIQLADEARMTAAVNHPNVVKVFDFGQDRGQFYIAMELVEKGSLDHLMGIQKRVAEVQVLEVGIQIAQGLNAALENGLIHRDIKPGNILFADAHTAKLVDFGLAIVMDADAQSKGEIWGTPYYIAPEKLDNQPEDFRSDIYSLGGTLFHALAGRPPYEADTPSMVALKQLKSQAVSLQSFAPDVTSETAYVINRMMAKDPADRYQSYDELIGHLHYAREKLLERAKLPVKEKQRVVLETAETRKWTAFLSLGLLVAVMLAGIAVFLNRERIFPADTKAAERKEAEVRRASVESQILAAATGVASGETGPAMASFSEVIANAEVKPALRNWAVLNLAFAQMVSGLQPEPIRKTLGSLVPIESASPEDQKLADYFLETARVIRTRDEINPSIISFYNTAEDSFSVLMFGMWNWQQQGRVDQAAPFFAAFLRTEGQSPWLQAYRPIAEKFSADWKLLEPAFRAARPAAQKAAAEKALAELPAVRPKLTTGPRAIEALEKVEKTLREKVGRP